MRIVAQGVEEGKLIKGNKKRHIHVSSGTRKGCLEPPQGSGGGGGSLLKSAVTSADGQGPRWRHRAAFDLARPVPSSSRNDPASPLRAKFVHEADEGAAKASEGVMLRLFPVPGEAAASNEAADSALDDPALWSNDRAFGDVLRQRQHLCRAPNGQGELVESLEPWAESLQRLVN